MAKKLPREKTKEELLAEIASLEEKYKGQGTSIFLYPKRISAKLDKLRREIVAITRAEKLARGETVNDAGYSGRQSNRR